MPSSRQTRLVRRARPSVVFTITAIAAASLTSLARAESSNTASTAAVPAAQAASAAVPAASAASSSAPNSSRVSAPAAATLTATESDGKALNAGQIVVTATRAGKAVEKIPGAVSVIDRQDIERTTLITSDPSELLALQVPSYSPSRQKLTSVGETMRGRSVLRLVDGIPQSTPLREGNREGYVVDPMILERVEVLSGASAVEGMGATGGIVNNITRTATDVGTHHTIQMQYTTQGRSNTDGWKIGYMLEHLSDGENPWDALLYAGTQQQDIGKDGEGRLLAPEGLHQDNSLFLKLGQRVGTQRVQLMVNRYNADGFSNWVEKDGDRSAGIPTSAEHGTLPSSPAGNRVRTAALSWQDEDFAGGFAQVQVFKQKFAARYTPSNAAAYQDTSIATKGELYDQSRSYASKWGVRSSWTRDDLWLKGLEFTGGLDFLRDREGQDLVLTHRTWVPPLDYRSTAPFAQLEYEIGNLTVRGGLRYESGHLQVDTFQTLAYYNNTTVEGGSRDANKLVKNLGAVWRFGNSGWSTYVSYSEGFGLPDVGLILRAVKTAGESVSSLADLRPVVTYSRDLGVSWRGQTTSFNVSTYLARSSLGSSLTVTDGIGAIERVPMRVYGVEATGEWRPMSTLKLNASYGITRGKEAADDGEPLNMDLSAREAGPDKLVAAAQWDFRPDMSAQLIMSHYRHRDDNEGKYSGSTSLAEHFGGYTLFDFNGTWHTQHGDWGLGIENLFDRQYITYYSQANYSGGEDDYYAGRGRTLTVSWKQRF